MSTTYIHILQKYDIYRKTEPVTSRLKQLLFSSSLFAECSSSPSRNLFIVL